MIKSIKNLNMIELREKSIKWGLGIINAVFVLVPESFFLKINSKIKLLSNGPDELKIILISVLISIIIIILVAVIIAIVLTHRKSVQIKGHNYCIQIEYGNILEMTSCKKVIPFDECFSTHVGEYPSDIKPNSICGQYLKAYPIQDIEMQELIDAAQLKPLNSKSKYKKKVRYESGKLVPKEEYLLMAFAKLDDIGRGELTREELLDGLSMLWKEIDTYYGQKDICIPILGSGITRIKGESLTQQQLLDLIIASYKLSSHKIKFPYKLRIVCKGHEDFSLNKIGENI